MLQMNEGIRWRILQKRNQKNCKKNKKDAYAMLIQWVTDHQSEERKYSKKEIYEAYREYLEEIYKYNLSDGTESSR